MATGRPTKLTPEVIESAKDYIANHVAYEDPIPSVAGLACHLNVARSTLYKWAEDEDSKFSDILEDLLAKQEKTLVGKGLSGDFNSTITKLILTKHNYSDKQELTGNDGGAIRTDNKWTIEFINPTKEDDEEQR